MPPLFEKTEWDSGVLFDASGDAVEANLADAPSVDVDEAPRFVAFIEDPVGLRRRATPLKGLNRTTAEFEAFQLGIGAAPGTKVILAEARGVADGRPVYGVATSFVVRQG